MESSSPGTALLKVKMLMNKLNLLSVCFDIYRDLSRKS